MKRILFILAELCLILGFANVVNAQNHVQTITVNEFSDHDYRGRKLQPGSHSRECCQSFSSFFDNARRDFDCTELSGRDTVSFYWKFLERHGNRNNSGHDFRSLHIYCG